ncbi:hypothetical protein E8E12_008231 [Didymella heteroderae]|uniref:DUF1772-domain-containing protein n=1 Tax=Didymella heteroderae TaxID=1769908 RepID=A0A9P4WTR5_9PLEO|nr:hypothetical protein E8E12_008231 [Didymella heteroderae]
METDTFTTLVQVLQITTATSLIFLGGLSSCLSLWLIPLISLLPPAQACRQFTQTVTWGFQYLQPSSRILGASLLLTTVLTSRLADAEHAQRWKLWAVALGILVPVAPYEALCIFPINDSVKRMGEQVRSGADEKRVAPELIRLLDRWRVRNYGRVVLPLVAGVVGWLGVVGR